MIKYISLLEDMKLVKSTADPYAPWFTGWKSADPRYWIENREPDESFGFCGQVIQFLKTDPESIAYVNLPGMECGVCITGNTFDIGTERIHAVSMEEMRELLLSGLKKLKEIVEEYKKGNPCPAAPK